MRWVAAITVLASAPALQAVGGGQAAAVGCRLRAPSAWRVTVAPAGLHTFNHADAEQGASYLAVDPVDSKRLYATPDTKRILRSLDGGCTWRTVFDLAAL